MKGLTLHTSSPAGWGRLFAPTSQSWSANETEWEYVTEKDRNITWQRASIQERSQPLNRVIPRMILLHENPRKRGIR